MTESSQHIPAMPELERALASESLEVLPNIPTRTPIFRDDEDMGLYKPTEFGIHYFSETLNAESPVMQQWRLIIAATRKVMDEDPTVCTILSQYIYKDVSQELPRDTIRMLENITPDTRAKRTLSGLINRYEAAHLNPNSPLSNLLNRPAIPENLVGKDIKSATPYQDPNMRINRYLSQLRESKNRGDTNDETYYRDSIRRTYEYAEANKDNTGTFAVGITKGEKYVLAARYRFAREIKMLALEAHLRTHGITEIVTTDQENLNPEYKNLLNPINWRDIRYLKDRVYELEFESGDESGTRKAIIKQRKTPMHMDNPKHGYLETRTSEEEIQIAAALSENETIANRVQVSFERPIGFVEYDDGFQFAVFEHIDKQLMGEREAGEFIVKEIMENRPEFEQEFQKVRERVAQLIKEPELLANRNLGNRILHEKRMHVTNTELSFEQYARSKATHTLDMAKYLRDREFAKRRLHNRDMGGYEFAISDHENCLINIIGFDTELTFEEKDINGQDRIKYLERLIDSYTQYAGNYAMDINAELQEFVALYALSEAAVFPTIEDDI